MNSALKDKLFSFIAVFGIYVAPIAAVIAYIAFDSSAFAIVFVGLYLISETYIYRKLARASGKQFSLRRLFLGIVSFLFICVLINSALPY